MENLAIAATLPTAPRPGSNKCEPILTPRPCYGGSFDTLYNILCIYELVVGVAEDGKIIIQIENR